MILDRAGVDSPPVLLYTFGTYKIYYPYHHRCPFWGRGIDLGTFRATELAYTMAYMVARQLSQEAWKILCHKVPYSAAHWTPLALRLCHVEPQAEAP